MKDFRYSFKKIDIFILLLLVIIVVITILCALNPTFGEYFSVANWFGSESLAKIPIWIAIGFVMLVCFLGALIPIPIPYGLSITLFAAVWLNEFGLAAWGFIILLVFLATLANTIGDLIDYLLGKGAQYVMGKDEPEVQNIWTRIILKKPKAIPVVIVIFGLTPLPDSLLMVPLGIAKYDIKKTFIWMFISRFVMMLIFALAGIYAIEWIFSEGAGDDPYGWVLGVVFLYILWILIVIMVKYNKPKEEKKTQEAQETFSNP
ncbi:MAG: hypothetical protein ACFFDN_51670 [Candidatus Hodarchaeota archaeon]